MKKIISTITALATLLTATITVQAETAETLSTVNIDGYTCYEKNGNYHTVVDNEDCIIIVHDESNMVTDKELIKTLNQSLNSTNNSGIALCSTAENWPNNKTVDISSGQTYSDSGDITYADYYSPMYKTNSKINDFSLSIHMGFVFTNSYEVTFYYYLTHTKLWYQSDITLTFNLASQTKVLLSGTVTPYIANCCLRFHEDSTGEKKFRYDIHQVV